MPYKNYAWAGSLLMIVFLSGCQTVGPGTATGGAFGTFAGTLTGAAIGSKEGKAPEGALIGALTGGALGAAAGNAVDREVQRTRRQDQTLQNERRLAAVSTPQIIQMTQSGLGSDVIVRQIQNQGVFRRPTIDDLIQLKNQGVDDVVIEALQSAPIGGTFASPTIVQQPIEVIQQPVFVEPIPPSYGFHYRKRYCGPRAGFSVRF